MCRLFYLFVPLQCQSHSDRQREDESHGCGERDAVHLEQMVHEEENRQVKQPLVEQCREGGVGRLPGRLHERLAKLVNSVKRAGADGGEHHDLAVRDDLFVVNEGGNNRGACDVAACT